MAQVLAENGECVNSVLSLEVSLSLARALSRSRSLARSLTHTHIRARARTHTLRVGLSDSVCLSLRAGSGLGA